MSYSKKRKSFLPKFLQIDFSKPLSFANQFTVMMVILLISCLLFTVVYVVQASRGVIVSKGSAVQGDVQQSNDDSSKVSENSSEGNRTNPSVQPQESSSTIPAGDKTGISGEDVEITEVEMIKKPHDEIYNGYLTLVNKSHECHHYGENVVSLIENKNDTYDLLNASVSLDESIVGSFNEMMDDFFSYSGGSDIMVACGYRDYDLQAELFEEEVEDRGSEEEAIIWVAPAGYSEHQTGYVFDLDLNIGNGSSGIDFDGTGVYGWLHDHSADYGYILRYLEGKEDITGYHYEPWHFRYVGLPHSEYITEKKYTMEEYIEALHEHHNRNALIMTDSQNQKWCVYYIKVNENPDEETEIPVPKNNDYEISGDNYSGFIVTVKLD